MTAPTLAASHRSDRPIRVRRLLGALVTLVLAVTACGIPVDEPPQALPTEDHQDLLEGTTTTTTSTVVDSEMVTVRLYFVSQDDKLEWVERPYAGPPEINTVLADLEQPPLEEDQAPFEELGFLLTLVPVGLDATLLEQTPEDENRGVRIIQVNPIGELRPRLEGEPVQGRLIVKQLVCTFLNLGGLDDVVGVELHDDQGQIPLFDDASQPIEGAAGQSDFGDCKTGTDELNELIESETGSTTTQPDETSETTEP